MSVCFVLFFFLLIYKLHLKFDYLEPVSDFFASTLRGCEFNFCNNYVRLKVHCNLVFADFLFWYKNVRGLFLIETEHYR